MEEPMDRKTDPVIHFELPTNDPDRSGRFNEQALGWRIVPLRPDMGGFVLNVLTLNQDYAVKSLQ
jgi:predicted enzyme related to lactoylglutathione lyase